jgi:hypothetical protein
MVMANGQVITKRGVRILFGRGYGNTTYGALNAFKIGRATTTPTYADTDMGDKLPLQTTEVVDACDATTGWTASGTNSVSLNTTNFMEGSGGLNLVKSDTGSANCDASKTTTSRDFTSKDFWLYVYISSALYAKLATSNCLTIRFGSDSSNYYQKQWSKSSLVSGWNLLSFNSGSGTITGSPVITAADFTFVRFTTINASDTAAAGDFVFDDIKLASVDDYIKPFLAGYPSFDEPAKQVVTRGHITATLANGVSISECGEANSDASPSLGSHDVFTPVVKNSSTELIIEWVHEVT